MGGWMEIPHMSQMVRLLGEIMSRMTYGSHRQEVTTTASLSVAAQDANVMSAVITHVKKGSILTFIDDTGLRPLFEKWSN